MYLSKLERACRHLLVSLLLLMKWVYYGPRYPCPVPMACLLNTFAHSVRRQSRPVEERRGGGADAGILMIRPQVYVCNSTVYLLQLKVPVVSLSLPIWAWSVLGI